MADPETTARLARLSKTRRPDADVEREEAPPASRPPRSPPEPPRAAARPAKAPRTGPGARRRALRQAAREVWIDHTRVASALEAGLERPGVGELVRLVRASPGRLGRPRAAHGAEDVNRVCTALMELARAVQADGTE